MFKGVLDGLGEAADAHDAPFPGSQKASQAQKHVFTAFSEGFSKAKRMHRMLFIQAPKPTPLMLLMRVRARAWGGGGGRGGEGRRKRDREKERTKTREREDSAKVQGFVLWGAGAGPCR